jgi:iron complex outermembrane receptor protein
MYKKKLIFTTAFLAVVTGFYGGTISQARANELNEYQLEQVIVEAKSARKLVKTKQTVGVLGEKDVMDTPFHETTFTAEALEQFSRAGRGLLDTISLDPAVRINADALETNAYIRGISTSGFRWNLNGVPGMTHQMQMPYNFISEVSVIAGPSLGITGSSPSMSTQAGGVINMISKKAEDQPNGSAKISWASDSYFTEEIDVGQRYGENKEYGLRFNIRNSNGGLAVDGTEDSQRNIYINFDHKSKTSKTNVLVGYDYVNQYGRSNTINLANSITALPSVPKNTNNLSPQWSQDKYENYTAVLNHEQTLSDHASYFVNAGYHKEDYSSWLQQWSSRVLQNMQGDYTGVYTQMPVYHSTHYLGTGIKGDFKLDDLQHNYVISVDKSWFRRTRDNNVSAANKYPVTGNIYQGISSGRPTEVWDKLTKHYATKMDGWNIIDTISTANEKLAVTLGAHGHKGDTYNYVDNTRVKASATCPVYAVAYRFTPEVMFYADHTETFSEGSVVSSGYSNSNEILPPGKTKQNEIGVKIKKDKFLHTLSLFEIEQQNGISVLNDDGKTSRYALDGQQRNRGIELSSVGDLNEKWSVIFGVAYLNAVQTKTQSGLNDGRAVSALPSWSSDLGLIYNADKNLSFTGRINYTGTSKIRETSSYAAPIKLPSATIVDLGLRYDTKVGSAPVTLSAMCYNLFNKNYWYASGTNAIGLGAPRTFMVSAKYNF